MKFDIKRVRAWLLNVEEREIYEIPVNELNVPLGRLFMSIKIAKDNQIR